MYNEELKTRYIVDSTKSIKTANNIKAVFNATTKYEKELGSDICTMSAQELQPIIDNILGIRSNSKYAQIAILKEYFKWCRLNNYPGAGDGIANITIVGLGKVRKQMVSNPRHLQEYLDALYEKETEETLDNVYRCYLWMAYMGIKEDDALEIKSSDVDLSNMIINHNETEFLIYREALPAFRNAVELKTFNYIHPGYKAKVIKRDRVDGDTILRGVKTGVSKQTIRVVVSNKHLTAEKNGRKGTNQNLSYSRIQLSGLFYSMAELERAGLPISFSSIAVSDTDGKAYSFGERESIKQRQNRKERNYQRDYEQWKLAFSI